MEKTQKDLFYISIIVLLAVVIVALAALAGINQTKTGAANAPAEEASEPAPSDEPQKSDTQLYYEAKCAAFAVQNANLSQGQIVFIGDSITDLFHLDDYFTDLPLATYNRGIGGDSSAGVLYRLQLSLFDIAPSKVVLMIGINDINGGVDHDTLVQNYTAILTLINTNLPAAEVYCMSVIPQHDTLTTYTGIDVDATAPRILAANQSIAALAASFGYTYVDLYSAVSDGSDHLQKSLSDDGIHLNAAGFAVWASVIKPYLQ